MHFAIDISYLQKNVRFSLSIHLPLQCKTFDALCGNSILVVAKPLHCAVRGIIKLRKDHDEHATIQFLFPIVQTIIENAVHLSFVPSKSVLNKTWIEMGQLHTCRDRSCVHEEGQLYPTTTDNTIRFNLRNSHTKITQQYIINRKPNKLHLTLSQLPIP